jgi:O-antigen biosynthesis protein WbqP
MLPRLPYFLGAMEKLNMSIRILDVIFAVFGILIAFPILTILYLLGYFDTGRPLFFQKRVGRMGSSFTLLKFRTMKVNTASVATHLADSSAVTKFGKFLRVTKLDELPQLWNVVKGEMSLVGPRPCLFSQEELIDERSRRDVLTARPGITGLAQVNGIDMSDPKLLAEFDQKMLETLNIRNYFKYILLTVVGKGSGDRTA